MGDLGLNSDDWPHLQWAVTQPLGVLMHNWPMDYRPFEELPWLLLHALFGLHLAWYYGVLFAIGLATAGLLYVLLARLTGSALLACGAALLWSVYPSEASQFWLTGIHYRLGLFFLVIGLVLLTGPRVPRRAAYGGALACCVCCLLTVELYLGSLLLLPLAAALREPTGRMRARVRRALPFLLLMGTYAVYRVWLGPHVLHLPDNKAGSFGPSLSTALTTEIDGAIMLLLQAWQVAIDTARHGIFASAAVTPFDARALITGMRIYWLTITPVWWVLLYINGITLAVALLTWMRRRRFAAAWVAIRPGALAALAGLTLVVIGFLALAMTAERLILGSIATRVGAAAAPGAALFVVGVVWVLAHWLPLPQWLGRTLFVGVVGLLTVLGWAQTARTAAIYAEAWTMQREMWGALLRAAPAPRPHTFLLVVAADKDGSDTLLALRPWGITSGLGLHYPNAGIAGDYLSLDEAAALCAGGVPHWTGAAYLPHTSATFVPASRLVVLRYAGAGGGQMTVARGRLALGGGCAVPSHDERLGAWRPSHGSSLKVTPSLLVKKL